MHTQPKLSKVWFYWKHKYNATTSCPVLLSMQNSVFVELFLLILFFSYTVNLSLERSFTLAAGSVNGIELLCVKEHRHMSTRCE